MKQSLWFLALAAPVQALAQIGLRAATPNVLGDILADRSASDYPNEALKCFEVTNPVASPDGPVVDSQKLGNPSGSTKPSCSKLLMNHVFANSYGRPFVGE